MRLQKYLAQHGYGSRRFCETLITDEKVYVNGQLALLGMSIQEGDSVLVHDMPVQENVSEKIIVYALHKPKGIETTRKNIPESIMQYVPTEPLVFPVGRLDKDSCGLILLTNSGALAQSLTHPKYAHEKEYHVRISSPLSEEEFEHFKEGLVISGKKTSFAQIEYHGYNRYSVILTEGRNRQIRKMMRAFGKRVIALKRVRIESIELGDLRPGEYRILTPLEYESYIHTS